MEDRLSSAGARRPGPAVIALVVILAITTGWWLLALWPAGPSPPQWLARTRAACFGAYPGELPDAGGWLLLVGQPLGMIGFLIAGWGEALRRDLARLEADPRWVLVTRGVGLLLLVGVAAASARVVTASGGRAGAEEAPAGLVTRPRMEVPAIELTDQQGRPVSLAGVTGPVLLTFAYGHCSTVCPTSVSRLQAARAGARRDEIPIFVVTLDPWRDPPERLASIAAAWRLNREGGQDRLLSGPVAQVEQVLDRLSIGRRRDPATGELDHSATTMLLDEGGRIVWRLDGGWGALHGLLAATRVEQRQTAARR